MCRRMSEIRLFCNSKTKSKVKKKDLTGGNISRENSASEVMSGGMQSALHTHTGNGTQCELLTFSPSRLHGGNRKKSGDVRSIS